jgi:hypothetical protein
MARHLSCIASLALILAGAAGILNRLGSLGPGSAEVLVATLEPQAFLRSLPDAAQIRIVQTWAGATILHLHLANGQTEPAAGRRAIVIRVPRSFIVPACG